PRPGHGRALHPPQALPDGGGGDGPLRDHLRQGRAEQPRRVPLPAIPRNPAATARRPRGRLRCEAGTAIDGQFTRGVEEEYQIVHPESRDLRSYVSEIMEEGGKTFLRERLRHELHQSMVEVGTTICRDVGEVRAQLTEMRGELDRLARRGGLRIVAASTHPFAAW